MRKLAICITLAVVFAAIASASPALTFDDIKIETWVGSGASRSVFVVDFGPESFAFGYNFDGAKTGLDMLNCIADNTELTFGDDTQFGGHIINSIGYGGYLLSYNSAVWDPTSHYWEYWTSANGTEWTSSWVGLHERALTDGAWDGWTFSPPWDPNVPSTSPDVPVPEPSAILALCSLIGLAGSTKLLRRK